MGSPFTAAEIEYIQSQGLARLATIRGKAEPLRVRQQSQRVAPHHSDELIRIRPYRVIMWNLPSGQAGPQGREVR